ncbi:MAG: glycosyltransferase [Acidobacteriota bacterium]
MRLVVVSHKRCWHDHGRIVSDGGFPRQIDGLAAIVDRLTLVVPIAPGAPADGTTAIQADNVDLAPLRPLTGTGLRRKLGVLVWLPRNLPRLWREIGRAGGVHALVPGDVGSLGLILALLRRKPIYVRHCGTWGDVRSIADRLLFALLEQVAGGKNVVLATGAGEPSPSRKNPAIGWIFSTALDQTALDRPARPAWRAGEPLRLVSVGRLSAGKNVMTTIDALLAIRMAHPDATLTVLGDGPERPRLEARAEALGLTEAVDFRGRRPHDEVLDVLDDAHLLLFPTRTAEGFPKAVLEALACGTPVIAPAVSAIPGLIEDCGVVLDSTEASDVTDAVNWLTSDPARLATMSTRARQRARQYTLQAWGRAIASRLETAWGRTLEGIKVAMIVAGLGRGGTEKQLLLTLRQSRWTEGSDPVAIQPVVFALDASQRALEAEIQALEVPIQWLPASKLGRIRTLAENLRGFDIVHAWSLWANPYAVVAGLLAGVPRRVGSQRGSQHATTFAEQPWWLRWLAVHGPQEMVTNSRAGVDELREAGVRDATIHHIPNTIEPPPADEPTADLTSLEIPRDAPVIGAIGNLRRVKNHLLLVDAFARVVKAHPDLHLVIAGGEVAEEPDVRPMLEATIRQHGLHDRAHLLGFRNDVGPLLRRLRLLVNPSDNEGSPNVILEALVRGVPVVATDVGGTSDLLPSDCLVPAGDLDALTESLREHLDGPVSEVAVIDPGPSVATIYRLP